MSELRGFADSVTHPRLACPATGLELAVIGRSAAASVIPVAGYLLEVDRAVCRQSGTALLGPRPAEVIAAVNRADALAVLAESLGFQHEKLGEWLTDSTVLNACRPWRYVVEDRWCAKPDAGAWAATQPGVDADLIGHALDLIRSSATAEPSTTTKQQ